MDALDTLVLERDAVLQSAPVARQVDADRDDGTVEKATHDAIAKLERIAERMQAVSTNGLERCRTLRHLARLKAALAPADGPEALCEAEWIFQEARDALQASDEQEEALLDYDMGSVLWQGDPTDVRRLCQAQVCLWRARDYFEAHDVSRLTDCDKSLEAIAQALDAARATNGPVSDEPPEDSAEQPSKPVNFASKLASLRQHGGSLDAMLSSAMTAAMARVRAKAAPTRSSDPSITPVSPEVPHGSPGSLVPDTATLLAALEARLQREVASGLHSPERMASLRDKVEFIKKLLNNRDESLAGLSTLLNAIREFYNTTMDTVQYPNYGLPRPPAESRAADLVETNWLLRRRLLKAMNRTGAGDYERGEAMSLSQRAEEVDKRIYEAGANDNSAAAVEAESLRPLAAAVRLFTGQAHAMAVEPLWGADIEPTGTQTVFHAGPPGTQGLLSLACRRAGLDLPSNGTGEDHARLRWRQLQRAAVAVFDLRAGTDAERADISYELGMALTLGKPVVVLADSARPLPFDVAIAPVDLSAASSPELAVADAVDRAICWTYPEVTGKPWRATLAHMLAAYPQDTGDTYVDQSVKQLRSPAAQDDPIVAHAALAQLLRFAADGRTRLVYPHWAPVYPAAGTNARLFHVTPFRPTWAEDVTELARAACRKRDAKYVRGDGVSQPDVVASIWTELARATHVLADLTGFNANVALELGIAHVLGKPVLRIGQSPTVDALFPSVRKLRLQPYALGTRLSALGTAIDNFLMP